ncbi:MAG: DUF2752 domain-containing protein [Lentisphaeria bacterium]|nr:DUF2752 domain-containing protein [Lentisphaeria bacterium]
MTPEKRKILTLSGVFFLIFGALGFYSFLTGKFQLCIFRIFTGLPCPGCGLTRSFLLLLQGDMGNSFRLHPLLLPVLFTLLTAFSSTILSGKGKGKKNILLSFLKFLHDSKYFYLTIFLLLILQFIVRMLLFFPGGTEVMNYEKHSVIYLIYSFFTQN